ncbi:MAG: type I methionyl aminopeptidase [Spirochaetales bacterium]|nr:type I methionyl aminopeptidase [Spirochaetales bacterium]
MIRLKNRDDIERIKNAGRILAETFQLLKENTGAGVTTLELDKMAHDYILSRGGKPAFLGYMGYPASICASVNQVVIHGIPNTVSLENGDILSLDLGVELNGYIADAAFTLRIGEVEPEVDRLLKVTEECLYLGIEQAKPGNRIHDISAAIYEHATRNGFGVVHQFCGHGVGFELHEDPQVPNCINSGPNPRIKNGMVLALEPMINIGTDEVVTLDDNWTVVTVDESISAHFEHTIAVVDGKPQILTGLQT